MNVSAISGRLNTCDQRIARWPWRSGVREPRRGGTSKRRGCRATVRARGYHVKATSLPRPSCEGDESAPHSSRRRRSCLSHTARSRGWRARSGVAARLETGLPRAPAPAAATGVCAPSTRGASVARPKAYASSKSPASLQSPSSTSTICTGRVGARRVAHGPTGASLSYVGLLARGASHQTTKLRQLAKMARHSLVRPPNATALCDPLNWGGPTIKGKPPGRRLSATSTLSPLPPARGASSAAGAAGGASVPMLVVAIAGPTHTEPRCATGGAAAAKASSCARDGRRWRLWR